MKLRNRELVNLTSCLGKVAFETFEQAKAVVERGRKGMHSVKRGIYRCPICAKWHAGQHSPQTKAKELIRKRKALRFSQDD